MCCMAEREKRRVDLQGWVELCTPPCSCEVKPTFTRQASCIRAHALASSCCLHAQVPHSWPTWPELATA